MALNITLDGYIFLEDGTYAGAGISYQAFWYPNGTNSSIEKWNEVRLSEASSYWNLNLGDATFLTQNGTALDGGIVLIAFWNTGGDRLADCSSITKWGAFEVVLTGASVYSNNVQIKSNIFPTVLWSNNIPSHAYVNTLYTFYNNSIDTHSWVFNNITMHHWYIKYGQIIFSIDNITETDYDWGNGDGDSALIGAADASYSWGIAGSYTTKITIRDVCGASTSETFVHNIYWHAPVPNISRCDSVGNSLSNIIDVPDTPIYFKYTGSDIDDTIVTITWSITDSGSYGNTDTYKSGCTTSTIVEHTSGEGTSWLNHSASPSAFTNPGTHNVTIYIIWNDGFSDNTIQYSESFIQKQFDNPPAPDIVCNEAVNDTVIVPSTVVSFNYVGTDVDDRIVSLDWVINDSGSYGNTNSVLYDELKTATIYHTNGLGGSWYGSINTVGAFTNPGIHTIDVNIHWNDGWDNQVISYSEEVVQGKFSGPTVNFTQDPPQAIIDSNVVFTNNSINTDRVGLGMPDHIEYLWTWYDDTVIDNLDSEPFLYKLNRVPTSSNCKVTLCAEWSDGWDINTTCVTNDVVFVTTVTVEPEDCYYTIEIIGTDSVGTATGYGWTVSSGTSSSGTFYEVWSSPIGVDQRVKTLCFSSVGWYKIEGFVQGVGNSTSDFKTIYINETCPDSGAIFQIWNGTGVLDTGADWEHGGIGVEDPLAAYKGTNGLLVNNVQENGEVTFFIRSANELNINSYNFLSFWINISKWEINTDIYIKLFSSVTNVVKTLCVSSYVMTDRFNIWQRVMIPLQRFMIKRNINEIGWPTYVNTLTFIVDKGIAFYLDNIALIMGEVILVAVCGPDLDTQGKSNKFLHYAPELDTYKVNTITDVPSISTQEEYIIEGDLIPDIDIERANNSEGVSPVITTFPRPINL